MSDVSIPAVIAASAIFIIGLTLIPVALRRAKSHRFLPTAYISQQSPQQARRVRNVIVLAWMQSFLPALIQRFTTSRRANTVANVESLSTLANAVSILLLGILVLYCALVLLLSLRRASVRIGALTVLLLPFAYNIGSTVANAQTLPNNAVGPIAVILALATSSVRLSNLTPVAYLLGVTAATSVGLGVFLPHIGLMAGSSGAVTVADKGILADSLLAGVYNHSNVLGTMLILALPTVLLVRHRGHQLIILLVTGVGILWSSSRTSLAATGVAIACFGLMSLLSARARPAFVALSVLAALGAVVLIPLNTHELEAFSSRGQIWIGSLAQAATNPVFGSGYGWYGYIAEYNNSLIAVAFNGHNLFVNSITTGGLVYLLVLALLFITLMVAASRFAVRGHLAVYVFVITYAVVSCLEVVARYRDLDPAFWAIVIPIACFILSAANLAPARTELARAPFTSSRTLSLSPSGA